MNLYLISTITVAFFGFSLSSAAGTADSVSKAPASVAASPAAAAAPAPVAGPAQEATPVATSAPASTPTTAPSAVPAPAATPAAATISASTPVAASTPASTLTTDPSAAAAPAAVTVPAATSAATSAPAATPVAASAPVATPVAAPATVAAPTITPSRVVRQAAKHPDANSNIKSTTLESIQISHEPGTKPDEISVTCYFIFKEKPASFFFEMKRKEKKLVFEFNDSRIGSPIPPISESPLSKCVIDERAINVNKDIQGLKPEFHNQVQVTFTLDNIPEIHVNDKSNVILLNYKWTTNPGKIGDYIVKTESKKHTPYIIGGAAAGVLAVGAVVLATHKSPGGNTADQPLNANDLPSHPTH